MQHDFEKVNEAEDRSTENKRRGGGKRPFCNARLLSSSITLTVRHIEV